MIDADAIRRAHAEKKLPTTAIVKRLNVSRSSVYGSWRTTLSAAQANNSLQKSSLNSAA